MDVCMDWCMDGVSIKIVVSITNSCITKYVKEQVQNLSTQIKVQQFFIISP